MEEKKRIRVDFTDEDGVDQECIDLSIAFTPACSIWLLLKKGMNEVRQDIVEMERGIKMIPLDDFNTRKLAQAQLDIAKLTLSNGMKFFNELSAVIKELEPQDKKPLIFKPNWKQSP